MSEVEARLRAALAGRYDIERVLGHGGMATVYLARDVKHGRQVAVKVLRPDLAKAVGAERFLREIAIAARLQHPHILALIDSGEADGFLYYVMPFAEGESLRNRLARGEALPVSEASRLLTEIVDGLAHAHRHRVVHRDLKPDNVMIAERHALVLDFGIAKALADGEGRGPRGEGVVDPATLTELGASIGTPAYMAPEQAAGEPDVDHRVDIYAVGVVGYELLAGRTPFTGTSQHVLMAHITQQPPPLTSPHGDVPPALVDILMKCLEKDPAARYQSADELLVDLEGLTTTREGVAGLAIGAVGRRWLVPIGVVALLAIGGFAWVGTSRGRQQRWVHQEAIPAIQRLSTDFQMDSAFDIATRAVAISPDDPVLASLWPRFSIKMVFRSKPPGATVSRATLGDTTRWTRLGTTPTDSVRIPIIPYSRLRIAMAGYRPAEILFSPFWSQRGQPVVLDRLGAPDSEMVHVSGGDFAGGMPGLGHLKPIPLRDFLMDRHEVTNRQFKTFVAAGGYQKREYWDREFLKDGHDLSWVEATALFKDKTGRPGPATWEGGDVPAGQADFPVGGVSWYEAAAYAKFAGKSLPTVYHWNRAAEGGATPLIVAGSNIESHGPAKGSTTYGMSPFSVFDLSGNVREWCENEGGSEQRYILGGGWSDPAYMFNIPYTQNPFDRSEINGIRLVKYLYQEPNMALAMQPLKSTSREFSKETPVSDVVFEGFRRMYDYDRTPLNARLESRDTTSADWTVEKVTFDAAYGDERVAAYLYLPRNSSPPFQTVIFFPGSIATYQPSSAGLVGGWFDFFVKNGRAVIWPIYKSTYERGDAFKGHRANETIFYRDHVLMWAKDMRRSIDYLGTRTDIDTTRLAYYGLSWGGYLGGLLPAVEPRFKASVLFVAGLGMERGRPEVEPINFLPRIKIPTIMLNAKYDQLFPTETSQKPFFRLLGSPPDRKRYVVYEGGHLLPRAQLIRESLDWLDKYLGPVK
jgi:formylglycine-generating enzyme required for sulfatase activity/dienelactone hydrolase